MLKFDADIQISRTCMEKVVKLLWRFLTTLAHYSTRVATPRQKSLVGNDLPLVRRSMATSTSKRENRFTDLEKTLLPRDTIQKG